MPIARVFARRTAATPTDAFSFTAPPPKDLPEIDAVHISVTFTYDLPKAEQLAEAWRRVGVPLLFGGPATGMKGSDFTPGLYLKPGYVITSRGCNNTGKCWFCAVPAREGGIRELPITDGYNILDDNLLQCSEGHVRAVFEMLGRQKERPRLTGGLEARLLRAWHVELIRKARVKRVYFAYDNADELEPLFAAGKLLRDGGISRASYTAACYVLVGYKGDTFSSAEKRLRQAWAAGCLPFAMLYRNKNGETDGEWRKFQREWVRPPLVLKNLREPPTGGLFF